MTNTPANHDEALSYAFYCRANSNLARSYLELHALLIQVWHAMNDDNPPDFPMGKIENALGESLDKSGLMVD